ncbi:unnamed protein product [Phytomonas sp. EM1]|nr:unnamed protein product [Phytomonas sp. EM1]|eukprot:CCW63336.1 unnamed protein product [Phytomonas sp. isolate EM1]
MTTIEHERNAPGTLPTPMRMQRDLSSSPSISRLGSTVKTLHIQQCIAKYEDDEHPLEHMSVTFEEDNLTVVTSVLLGKGGFGKVFLARSNGGESYALKVSSKKMSENDWKRLNEEVTLMSHFSRHPNIVKFYAAGRDRDRAYVLMERCASRSVHDIIAFSSLDIQEILWIGNSLVTTVAYIHSKMCIHRDLKPQNLLFDFDGNLKITDFGLSSRISEAQPRKTVAGTAMYMAPEMAEEVYKRMTKNGNLQSLSYGDEVDTWSIGVVLYVLLTRMNPYLATMEERGVQLLDKSQKSLALFNAVADAAWSWPKGWKGDPQLCELVERVLMRDRGRRATLQEVCEDPVWNRSPVTCPLSLLQKLDMLEQPMNPLGHLAENVLTGPKKTFAAVINKGLERIEVVEKRHRSQLQLEYYETFNILLGILTLSRNEIDERFLILRNEETSRAKLRNQWWGRRQVGRRAGSVSLVSDTSIHGSVGFRSPRSVRNSVDLSDSAHTEQGEIIRASPDQYAVIYPGRSTATRWSLRSVVSLPRELNETIEKEFRCLNKHVMTKLTSMPHRYNGFDCNVCDSGIEKITGERPAFRCYKCDYDVCMNCAYSGKFKDVNFVCPTCGKKFTSSAKLHSHSLRCRGPSMSPSPRRSSRMNTLVWDEVKRPSLLEVQLPVDDDEPDTRRSRGSGRKTYPRTSTGGRISIGNREVPSPEDMGALVMKHRDAEFPRISALPSSAGLRSSKKNHNSSESLSDASLESGSHVSTPNRTHAMKTRRQDSLAGPHKLSVGADEDGYLLAKRRHVESNLDEASAPKYNENGMIVGIAARRRAESISMAPISGAGVVTIRVDTADKPREVFRQPKVPRSVSMSNARAISKPGLEQEPEHVKVPPYHTRPVQARVGNSNAVFPVPPDASTAQHYSSLPQVPQRRAGSVSGHTASGGPPLPRRGPAAPQTLPTRQFDAEAAVPRQNFSTIKQSRNSLLNPMHAPPLPRGMSATATHLSPTPKLDKPLSASLNANMAYVALPQKEKNRQQFVDDFLRGGWVRFYSFTQEDTVVMYYCLQPGRYGAMFPTEAGVGTAVLDIFSKLVLYVPCMNNESTNRNQPHPHVQTFYDEEVRILSLSEAQRYLGSVLRCVTGFIDEITRLKAEGLTPAAVHSAYIHQHNLESVPRDTKFVYIRKVFPDPCGTFTLFRLSNLRSQVVCNAMLDIRWQSDRRHHVGQKYYVHADGTTEPFVVDNTGVLSQVEEVLNNNYRR